jgi:hypothetical protein
MDGRYGIKCECLGILKNGRYRLKISSDRLGIYIFGFTAQESHKSPSRWWIQPPSTNTKNGWKQNPEFDKNKPLWEEIEYACITALESYTSTNKDEVISEADIKELLDKGIRKLNLDEGSQNFTPWMNEG